MCSSLLFYCLTCLIFSGARQIPLRTMSVFTHSFTFNIFPTPRHDIVLPLLFCYYEMSPSCSTKCLKKTKNKHPMWGKTKFTEWVCHNRLNDDDISHPRGQTTKNHTVIRFKNSLGLGATVTSLTFNCSSCHLKRYSYCLLSLKTSSFLPANLFRNLYREIELKHVITHPRLLTLSLEW